MALTRQPGTAVFARSRSWFSPGAAAGKRARDFHAKIFQTRSEWTRQPSAGATTAREDAGGARTRSQHRSRDDGLSRSRRTNCNKVAGRQKARLAAARGKRGGDQINRQRSAMTRSIGGGSASTSSRCQAARGAWEGKRSLGITIPSSERLSSAGAATTAGLADGAVNSGVQHLRWPWKPAGAPPLQQSFAWQQAALSASAASGQARCASFAALRCRWAHASLMRPSAHMHAVLGKPANSAKGSIPQATQGRARFRRAFMANRTCCQGRHASRRR